MIQLSKFNPIFFNPRKYEHGIGEYTQRFDIGDIITFEYLSGKGEAVEVKLNDLITGGSEAVEMITFEVSDTMDAHYVKLQPGEGLYSISVGGEVRLESEPFNVCQCKECTSLLEYTNVNNNMDGGAFVHNGENIPFMFRFEGGIKPFDTEHRCEAEYFRNQKQEIRNLYQGVYEVLKLTVGDNSMGCPEWYAGFFNTVFCLTEIKINGEVLARSEGSTPEKTQMQEGSNLIYFKINVEPSGGSVSNNNGNFPSGGGSGFSAYIITTKDLTSPSDKNVFSALRTLSEIAQNNENLLKVFLRKDQEDTTYFLLNLLGGIISPFIQSPDFVSGLLGAGMTFKQNADGSTYGEIDKLMVRKKAVFAMLSIMETELAGASFLFNPTGARVKITAVERIESVPFYYRDGIAKYYSDGRRAYVQPGRYGAVYRCYFLADDGETAVTNRFHVGNLARSQSFNIRAGVHEGVSNHYFWRRVEGVGDDYIDLSVTHCDEGSDEPKAGDVVVQLGDDENPDYQSAIELSSFGDTAPMLTFYQGINSYSTSGKDVFSVGYDRARQEMFQINYGRSYTGDRGRKSYIEFTPSEGLKVRANEITLTSGMNVENGINGAQDSADKAQASADKAQGTADDSWAEIKVLKNEISSKVTQNDLQSAITQSAKDITLSVKNEFQKAGLTITANEVKVNAGKFKITNSDGTKTGLVFEWVGDKPMLKTECIDVDNLYVKHLKGATGDFTGKVTANQGSIGGFKIGGGFIGAEVGGDRGYGSLSINANFIRVGASDMVAYIGADLSPIDIVRMAARFEVKRPTPTYEGNVGAYIDVTGANTYDNEIYSGNHALLINRGHIQGFRLRVRRLRANANLSTFDSIIVALTKGIELTLPSNAEDGQFYLIRTWTTASIYIKSSKKNIHAYGDPTMVTDRLHCPEGNLVIMFYDAANDVWLPNHHNHW